MWLEMNHSLAFFHFALLTRCHKVRSLLHCTLLLWRSATFRLISMEAWTDAFEAINQINDFPLYFVGLGYFVAATRKLTITNSNVPINEHGYTTVSLRFYFQVLQFVLKPIYQNNLIHIFYI